MSYLSRKFLFSIVILSSIAAMPTLYASDATKNDHGAILLKASDVMYHPAPGFPKGAMIALLRGDLSKAEPYTIRFKWSDGFVIPSHWHTTDEEVTVLSGTLNVGMGDKVDKSESIDL